MARKERTGSARQLGGEQGGWRHPGTHRVLWAEDARDVVLEGLQCAGPTPLLLLEGGTGCASAVYPIPAAARAREVRLTHSGGDGLPILWQRQGGQGVPGAQLCQLAGQQVPLHLQLGLGTEAALELLPCHVQPLSPAQQVHPGEGAGQSAPAALAPRPPLPHLTAPRGSGPAPHHGSVPSAPASAAPWYSQPLWRPPTPPQPMSGCKRSVAAEALAPAPHLPLPMASPTHQCWTLSRVSSFSCSSPGTKFSVSSSRLSSKDTAGGTSDSYLWAPSTALPPHAPCRPLPPNGSTAVPGRKAAAAWSRTGGSG